MIKKPSFFSRLTGSGDSDEYEEYTDDTADQHSRVPQRRDHSHHPFVDEEEVDAGGELAVDVYQTPDQIVIKAFIAGVQPNSIDVSLTREMVTISGTREEEKEVEEEGFFQRELYWGSFSRTILLPEEVDVDLAEATEKHGVLSIRLPKVNKKRQTKLKVRTR